MSLSESAVGSVPTPGGQIDRSLPARSIRETSLYAASLGLFGVLTGLALFTPLNALADNVLDDPLGGNWSARLLAIGLLALTGFNLHALTATMGEKSLAGSSAERHPSLPGIRSFTGYHAALTDMWSGAVLVVLLIVLAAAIPRGITVFLAAYAVFLVWNGGSLVAFLVRSRIWVRRARRSVIDPIGLVRQLVTDRHVPAFPEDLESTNRGDHPGVELMYVRTASLTIWDAALQIVASALLWVIASNSPGLAGLVSLIWLVMVVGDIVLWYRLVPQFFSS
jgi:hypothetical protein